MPCSPFHLAIAVDDISAARRFYGGLLGCSEGRSSSQWVDFDFFGHQLVVHCAPPQPPAGYNTVDGHAVPVPHFGIVLDMPVWERLQNRLTTADIEFVVPPHVRFAGQAGEQGTFFVCDPAGNTLEFKGFVNREQQLFAAG